MDRQVQLDGPLGTVNRKTVPYGTFGDTHSTEIRHNRHKEMDYVQRAERAYERMVEAWREEPTKTAAG
jgi:hypothetical protein